MSLPSSPEAQQIRARHFAGLFLLSLATLLLELALTRVLSVSLWTATLGMWRQTTTRKGQRRRQ